MELVACMPVQGGGTVSPLVMNLSSRLSSAVDGCIDAAGFPSLINICIDARASYF